MAEAKFYVYCFTDAEGCLYVGKGSGRRFATQRRRFGCDGKIIERFTSERKAYEAERRYIAQLQPRANVHPGGNGARSVRRVTRKDAWTRAYGAVGPRRFSALLLLACERAQPGILAQSKVDAIRQVAHGCRA